MADLRRDIGGEAITVTNIMAHKESSNGGLEEDNNQEWSEEKTGQG